MKREDGETDGVSIFSWIGVGVAEEMNILEKNTKVYKVMFLGILVSI